MPQVLIAVDKFMVDPTICREKKQWPPFEMIRNTKLEELVDHPWFKLLGGRLLRAAVGEKWLVHHDDWIRGRVERLRWVMR